MARLVDAHRQVLMTDVNNMLDDCSKERIHIPSAIQSHGYLMVTDIMCHSLLYLSQNSLEFFDIHVKEMRDQSVANILPNALIDTIREQTAILATNKAAVTNAVINFDEFDVIFFRSAEHIIIELEQQSEAGKAHDLGLIDSLEYYCSTLLTMTETNALHDFFAQQVRKVTGFDRVKIYQFDASWNGCVIAEDKANFMASYNGLNFPASDIPAQARSLYEKNLIRLIANVNEQISPVLTVASDEEQPLDMTYCVLRSVAPVHIQYLKNMGVTATMSVSIMQDGELWGMLVNHHNTPKIVSYRTRLLCEVMMHLYSAKLAKLINERKVEVGHSQKNLLKAFSNIDGENTEQSLRRVYEESIECLEADGLLLFNQGKVERLGNIPDTINTERIAEWWLSKVRFSPVATEDLEATLMKDYADAQAQGGALFMPLGVYKEHFAMWYRLPIVKKVVWAGNPGKLNHDSADNKVLSPRLSFEKWQADVEHQSEKWDEMTIATAQGIANILLDSERHHALQLGQLKTQFLSEISHELRTPLTAMSSIIQILKDDASLHEPIRDLVLTLDTSSKAVINLINDVLDIDRVESNATDVVFVPFQPQALIEEVRSIMAVQCQKKTLTLNVQYLGDVHMTVLSDILKIRQILFNLVGNAIKFTQSGFINIICKLAESKREVTLYELVIEVTDSGVGIPENELPLIFDKFYQARNSAQPIGLGSGLGLPISHSLAQVMGGDITVTSKVGMGSKFVFSVSVDAVEEATDPMTTEPLSFGESESRIQPLENRKRVLLAEDYEGNIVAIVYYLQSRGFSVSIAKNGQQAIAQFEREDFDIILMDVQMPEMGGIEAATLIREIEKRENKNPLPILAMTATTLKEDIDECFAVGMSDYIAKPITLSDLLKRIHVLLEPSR